MQIFFRLSLIALVSFSEITAMSAQMPTPLITIPDTSGADLGEKAILFSDVYSTDDPVKNPLTSEVKNANEVGRGCAVISLDKMNVFYVGVDNPISVSVSDVAPSDVKVSGIGVTVDSLGGCNFIVRATTPGKVSLIVSMGDTSQIFNYRVKRMPDPIPMLGVRSHKKTMPNGTFKAQGGIVAILGGFDFDARCDVGGFEVVYQPKGASVITKVNYGARWSADVAPLIEMAKPGDMYFFNDIKCKCPGDTVSRNLGSLSYKIR